MCAFYVNYELPNRLKNAFVFLTVILVDLVLLVVENKLISRNTVSYFAATSRSNIPFTTSVVY